MKKACVSIASAVLLLTPVFAAAQSMTDNLRWTVDAASRGVWVEPANEFASALFLGLDLRKTFSSDSGDIGTLLVQPYLIRLDNMAMHPPFFEGPDDTDVEYRIFNFNLTRWGRGRTNIRVGHFEIPFGLEQVVNTNGTLRDYLHGANIGVKADWGLTLNGDLPMFEYELALSRGSGNDWSDRGSPYLLSGRIGSPRENSIALGLSFLSGRVQDFSQSDLSMDRQRVALDMIWHGPFVDAKLELSGGDDESRSVRTGLVELDVANRDDTLAGYLQFVHRRLGSVGLLAADRTQSIHIGAVWTPDNNWSMSAQWSRVLQADSSPRMSMLTGQIRYRF